MLLKSCYDAYVLQSSWKAVYVLLRARGLDAGTISLDQIIRRREKLRIRSSEMTIREGINRQQDEKIEKMKSRTPHAR
tara:strand:- start:155 stop:388 length:234 start_codon:yes stop_codon:yes gene_type:complete